VDSARSAVLLARKQARGAGLKPLSHTPVRFVLVGIANTLTGLLIIYLLKGAFGVHDVPANLIGYAVGLCVSFLLNSRWTFAFRGTLASAAPRFAVVVVVAYLANLAAVSAALHWLSLNSYVAQAAGVVPYALVTYFGSKFFAFVGTRALPNAHAARTSVR
jgi:putative flippase GtrA